MINTWQTAIDALASAVIVAGGLAGVLRPVLRGAFVTRVQHAELEKRVSSVELRIATLPTSKDVRELTERLGRVETAVATTRTSIEGLDAGLKRVERMLGLLMEHQLKKGDE